MYKKYNQYYFKIKENESFTPQFPSVYDTLIIEYLDLKWSLPRNKIIDKFIRKSTQVYSQINNNEEKYTLRFLFEGKEIYAIPYDDINYPENAVRIMSHKILRHLS